MSFASILTGIIEMQAGAALDVFAGGAGGLGNMLIAAGAGQVISGVGSMIAGDPVKGFATTTRNSISPWRVCYGESRPKGSLVYAHMWGNNDQMLDLVIVLAAHPCQSIDELLFDQQRVQIDTNAIPTSAAAGYTLPWAVLSGSGTSFTPVQQSVNITSIGRANDVVTVVLPKDIPYLQAGDQIRIQNITGDYTLNGTFQVAEIISRVPSGGTFILTFTYLSGGIASAVTSEGQAVTLWADYGRNVYMEVLRGNQPLGETFVGMTAGTPWQGTGKLCTPASPQQAGGAATPNPWTQYCSLQNKTAVFLRLQYDAKYFGSGLPQISFHVSGKNDIYDPRLGSYGSPGTTGYTNNAALCVADHLTNQTWGFKFAYGSDVPTAPLIAAANTCDTSTALAAGGTEPLYTCNGSFELTQRRGEVLDDMLTSCAGRRVEINGQQFIYPGAWNGPGAAVNLTSMAAGPFTWRPTSSIRDLYNGCKGTCISPANKWQSTDFPYYAQDTQHGYSGPSMYNGDINLAADGGDRRWLELHLPFTISSRQAQYTAKVELLRRRNGATGTFPLNMAGYRFAPLDVIQATVPALAFSGEALEIQRCRLKIDSRTKGAPLLSTEIDVQATNSNIYTWSTSEELTPQGYVQTRWPAAQQTETEPRPWSPGYVSPLAGDAIGGAATFGMQPVYGVDVQGNATAVLQIKGTAPISALDTGIEDPQIFCTALASGGSLPDGEYVVGLTAYDSGSANHGNSDYLYLGTVFIQGGGGSGSISISIKWGSGDDGGDLYLAAWNADGQVFHYNQTLSPGAASATITSFNQSTAGGPDALFDHFAVTYQAEVHAGVWAAQVHSVTPTTVTIGGAGMTANLWNGYTLSLLAKFSAAVEIPVLNMPVASSTASSGGLFTLTIGPNAASVQLPDLTTLLSPLDLVVMRGKYTFAASSFTDPNVANPYYPSGATGVETGHVAVVLTGADAGDVQSLTGVTADGFGNDTVFNLSGSWEITPATGDIVVICSPSQAPKVLSASMTARNGSITGVMAQPDVQNLALGSWLFTVQTEDATGNQGPVSLAPMREVYLFGGANTLPLLMLSVDGTLAIQSDACPAVYLPAARTPSGFSVYVKAAPVGQDAKVSLWVGSTLWMQLTITAGTTTATATAMQMANAAVIPANTQIRLSIDQVGTSSPGSDLSAFLYR